ncbi:hypothetical protein ACFFRR_010515 [Megaselia abdita]
MDDSGQKQQKTAKTNKKKEEKSINFTFQVSLLVRDRRLRLGFLFFFFARNPTILIFFPYFYNIYFTRYLRDKNLIYLKIILANISAFFCHETLKFLAICALTCDLSRL